MTRDVLLVGAVFIAGAVAATYTGMRLCRWAIMATLP